MIRPPIRSIELVPAHVFACDECGVDNFVRRRRIDPQSDDGVRLSDEIGAFIEGEFLTAPMEVKCSYCGAEFSVEVDDAHD